MKTKVPAQANITHQRGTPSTAVARQTRSEATFVDDRPIEVMQRRMNEITDSSPRVMQQRALANMIDNSPGVMQRRMLSAHINHSPRMTAQREKTAQLFGGAIQREEDGEQDLLQGKFPGAQRLELERGQAIQEKSAADAPTEAAQASASKPNNTGLPNQLKSGIESMSGLSMDHVKVHYNSSQPAQLNALAYAQGGDIHVGPGQEKHLPHEAWHVVQQVQGRVQPTMQMKDGVPANDDKGLEHEADVMGAKAVRMKEGLDDPRPGSVVAANTPSSAVQMKIGLELQSSWTILRIGINAAPDSKDVAYHGIYFQIEVDKGNGRAELEIVSYPLQDREAFDGCVAELRHVVGQLAAMKGKIFTIGPGDGWPEETQIQRTSEAPVFRMQYTEGVTVENIPSLIKQFHPAAWRDMPDVMTGKKEKAEKKAKRTRADEADEYDEPDATKIRGLTAAICMFLGDVGMWASKKKDDDIKYAFTLMARTDFYSMYHDLDDVQAAEFQELFADDQDTFHGYALDGQVFGRLELDVTVRQWLQSMVAGRPVLRAINKDIIAERKGKDPKDLMSPPPGLNTHGMIDDWNANHPKDQAMKNAMGMYGLDEDGLALFELRQAGSAYGQDLESSAEILEGILDKTAERDPAFATKNDPGLRDKRSRRAKGGAKGGSKGDPLGAHAGKKLGQDYLPTQAQVTRMIVHNRQLDWVAPDGLCMLGALARLGGTTVQALRAAVLVQLANAGSAACAYINEFVVEHDAGAVRNVVLNLEAMWNAAAADAVLPVAALVAGVHATVIEPDGTPIDVNGGGTIILHVGNPAGHYHSTLPA